MQINVISTEAQLDGSTNYLLNIKGLSIQITELGQDTVEALKDGKISAEEAGKLLTDINPEIGHKVMGLLMLARMLGWVKG